MVASLISPRWSGSLSILLLVDEASLSHIYLIFTLSRLLILHTFFSIFFGLLTTIALGRVQAHCDHFLEISIFHFLLSNFSVFFLPISGSWRVSSSLKFISSHSFSNRDLWYTILDLDWVPWYPINHSHFRLCFKARQKIRWASLYQQTNKRKSTVSC